MKKIVTVLGARPQFIKAAVVSRNIASQAGLTEVIVHTGQHFDANMSDIFFDEMEIPKPDYNLNINGLGHGGMTGQMLEKIEGVLLSEKPDLVLVYGDTNSTLAGALAAKKLHIPVAHVEAGLRSFNMRMPEEINRIVTDRISDLLFCPTQSAMDNLANEGYANIATQITNAGDVMLDAALFYAKKAKRPPVNLPSEFALCTIHRSENTDDPMRLSNILSGLKEINRKLQIVVPIHPRTRGKLVQIGFNFELSDINFINPVGYFEMIYLINNSKFIITDSGGLQKEAYFFGKHCLVTRDETEWTELIEGGFNFICGSDPRKILDCFESLYKLKTVDFGQPLYGDGEAGNKIILAIADFLDL